MTDADRALVDALEKDRIYVRQGGGAVSQYLWMSASIFGADTTDPCVLARRIAAIVQRTETTAGEDTKRLNMVERMYATVHCNFIGGPEHWTCTTPEIGDDPSQAFHGESVREAIDRAAAAFLGVEP